MLEVKEISKYYGSKMAIENITFSAKRGQVIGLLGHNGCGKTTTMSIIANCLMPSHGDVLVEGVSVGECPQKAKKKIGYLPEIPPLYPDMTVEEQFYFACGLRRLDAARYEEEITRVCKHLNIVGVRKRLIGNLSKGYRQRVGFAQALLGHPPLLILDEPTVGLDPQQIIKLRELIMDLKKEHTVILSSHILSEIAATCDRIVVLSNGHLVADDTLEDLIGKACGWNKLLLQADGEPEEIVAIIGTLPGVKACDMGVSQTNGELEYRIDLEPGARIHRELFEALAAKNYPIGLLRPVQANLEEIFLQLTQDRRHEGEGGLL